MSTRDLFKVAFVAAFLALPMAAGCTGENRGSGQAGTTIGGGAGPAGTTGGNGGGDTAPPGGGVGPGNPANPGSNDSRGR
ncbi:MAG TPA: hypothetical protein VG406_25640 [Isosphaeraceae bacterium]|jgi:hypothetical protein|nr:hypothetical protein [Isosphaeraceae bacterium]